MALNHGMISTPWLMAKVAQNIIKLDIGEITAWSLHVVSIGPNGPLLTITGLSKQHILRMYELSRPCWHQQCLAL